MNLSFSGILRGSLLAATACSLIPTAWAAPVLPEQAMSEAADFLSHPMTGRKGVAASPELSLAYTGGEETPAFYIFNHEGGFVIISADDRLPSLLGYSENGEFDLDRIPENFKWWLGEYSMEIEAWLPTAPENLPGRTMRAPVKRDPIAPMTKTTWNQDAPYNDNCPLDQAGRRSVTGCVATAMAQLMKYHEWPLRPKGSSGGIVFDGTTYDWKNMIDNYVKGDYTAAQASAVATLMRQCGAAVNMHYSSWSSGAYDKDVPYAFTTYFNYGPDIKMVWKDYTPLSIWTETVYAELAAGRPLYYSGSSNEGGHAFVCDGYSENDLFHFNWGWGGYQDGYFRLTALNPASGGAGSYEGGYNSGQTILTGLAPNKTGEPVVTQEALISTGGFYYDGNNTYKIMHDPRGFNLIYNPMVNKITATIGVKITDLDNPGIDPRYASAGTADLQSGYGLSEMTVSMPTLPDGTYGITPVFKTTGDWMPILIPLGKQNYVRLVVAGGKPDFQNVGADDSNKANLIINMPESTPVIYGNADMAFRLPVLNVGSGDYMGYLGFTLMDKNDDFGDSLSMSDSAPVGGKGYTEWEVSFQEPIAAGEYLLFINDDSDNMLIDGAEITVVEGNLPEVIDTGKVTVERLAPNFITSDMENPIYFTVKSTSIFTETVSFRFTILNAESLEKVMDLPSYTLEIPANYEGRVVSQPHDLGIAPGKYMWYASDLEGNAISASTPLIVTSPTKVKDGIYYIITDEARKLARVVSPESGPYEASVNVPATIDGYTVEDISADAFAFTTASSVSLPTTITEIPDGGFYDAWSMRSLTLNSPELVTIGKQTFLPKYAANCWLVAPDGLSNTYKRTAGWSDFRMTGWVLDLTDVEIASGMATDPSTGEPYSPYFVNCLTPLTITFRAAEGMNVEYLVVHNGGWEQWSCIDPVTTSVELPAIGMMGNGKLKAFATTNAVANERVGMETEPQDVYSIDGRVVLRKASPEAIRELEPGIYIVGGRRHLVNQR